jgi:hypothetical protein
MGQDGPSARKRSMVGALEDLEEIGAMPLAMRIAHRAGEAILGERRRVG